MKSKLIQFIQGTEKLLLASLLLYLLSCHKDESHPCSIEELNQSTFNGLIYICDTIPGKFKKITGKATLSIQDSVLSFHLWSTDSTFTLSELSTAILADCSIFEGDVDVRFYDLAHPEVIGDINNKKNLYLDVQSIACSERQIFIGLLEE